MEITEKLVEYVAHLSRISLNHKELGELSVQLKAILDFIEKLNEVDTANVNPTSHILPINNVLREDLIAVSLPAAKVLENAPLKERNFFVVPKVID